MREPKKSKDSSFGEITVENGLFAFDGRPSLYYPAVKGPEDERGPICGENMREVFPARLAGGLGTAKFLCGAALSLLGGAALYVQVSSPWTYGGIWSGLFAVLAGLCWVLASRRGPTPSRALSGALLCLAALGFFNTGLLATFTAMGLVSEVYMEDVAGSLVWKGVENASPFTVQLLLLTIATADCLLSLACCVISGRHACRCCHRPDETLIQAHMEQRRDRLVHWLGAQQASKSWMPPKGAQSLPPVTLVPSVARRPKSRPRTPSTIRVFPPSVNANDSLSSSAGTATTTTKPSVPLVVADELQKKNESHRRRTARKDTRVPSEVHSSRRRRSEQELPIVEEKYFALDKQLSEEFIDRSLNYERSRQSSA